ncbi:NAD+ synthase [Egicoccus halophilus]|uniref:Glutamine-dependent NAD(+) synthetase n=1 Tax=Egicoccus halophilus TaxID=1670830 RepID=A0A8J3EUR1_9ACTN|nr:NAD+ synthase [Egicoccus halophilus]GGI08206.1 NAD+ synthase (glutamine-hydrolysing) [Egicoccus halophilus]
MPLRLALAQIRSQVGDIDGNVERVLDAWRRAADLGADLVVFTELTTTGYPPEDLLLKPEFLRANLDAVRRLATEGPHGTVALVGYVGTEEDDLVADDPADHTGWEVASAAGVSLTNSAAVLADGAVVATYDKFRLPNYGVFDEARYFTPRDEPLVVRVAGVPVGVTICEDLWLEPGPVGRAAQAGAKLVANLNASPYHRGKHAEREDWARRHVRRDGTWLAYVNVVGGQDDVVFDGDSFLLGPDGEVTARGAQFAEDLVVVDVPVETAEVTAACDLDGHTGDRPVLAGQQAAERLDPVGEVWHALVLATRDYCHRNGFEEAIIGLSGGIDSAVVAAVAADALGGEHVLGVAMPSPYSSQHSLDDAESLAKNFGSPYHVLQIEEPMAAVGRVLGDLVVTGFGEQRGDDREAGVAYENIQARLRGVLVMALSNERGSIVLTTGNKSEYAVGYATLYGDMAGGFAPLKDVPKLLVYELARWRNAQGDGELVPVNTIEKAPSAELRPDQRDDDSLPPYEILDDIIEGYVERDLGLRALVERGHDEATVRRVVQLVDRAEYKRRQAAPGPKVTCRAFGRERRVPMTNDWQG